MIARISTEDQFRLSDDVAAARCNELDNAAVAAVDAGRRGRISTELCAKMLALVAPEGEPAAADELGESDVILPPADTSFRRGTGRVQRRGPAPGLTIWLGLGAWRAGSERVRRWTSITARVRGTCWSGSTRSSSGR